MATYQLSILTPQGEVFNGQVESLSAEGQLGGFGVLPGHSPIIYALKRGILKILVDGLAKFVVHESGILEVKPDHNVLVLVDEALLAADEPEAKSKLSAQTTAV